MNIKAEPRILVSKSFFSKLGDQCDCALAVIFNFLSALFEGILFLNKKIFKVWVLTNCEWN